MTIEEIQKTLKTSFKNGFYIRRPSFDGIEVYLTKDNHAFQISNGNVLRVDLMKHEFKVDDWEIV